MNFALFEDTLNPVAESSYLFLEPVADIIVNFNQDELSLASSLEQVDKLRQQGLYIAGYIAYDAIFAMEAKLKTQNNHNLYNSSFYGPMLHFIAFAKSQKFASKNLLNVLKKHQIQFVPTKAVDKFINFFEFEYDFNTYQQKFDQVQYHLKIGDSYQVNLTLKAKIGINQIDNFDLYYLLSRSQLVSYAAFMPQADYPIISISPELFFQKRATEITVRPIKGTLPRGNNLEEDGKNCEWLRNDHKNLAENLIIVDLLRNDLAKFCVPGSVHPNKLFTIEPYASLFQMTSEIAAKVDPELGFAKIIKGLFPCGSITGAPKLRTMELIAQIESSCRGIYTGAIGYVLPNNDMCFNVAIRTLSATPNPYIFNIGVGGGITVNSSAVDEWNEVKTKLKFIAKFYQPQFALVESMLIANGEIVNLGQHLARLESSAVRLMFECDISRIEARVKEYILNYNLNNNSTKRYKLRLELDFNSNLLIEHDQIEANPEYLQASLLNYPLNTSHPLFQHKTTAEITRGLYNDLYARYKPAAIDELIFINQNGIITESRYFNLILNYQGKLITSPARHGLLPGIFRRNLLEQKIIYEEDITLEKLNMAQELYLCNDVRGMLQCRYLDAGIVPVE